MCLLLDSIKILVILQLLGSFEGKTDLTNLDLSLTTFVCMSNSIFLIYTTLRKIFCPDEVEERIFLLLYFYYSTI